MNTGLRENCGVFGVFGVKDGSASKYTYLGLFKLQHRGQESAGIALNENGSMIYYRGLGLVQEVFQAGALNYLKGQSAIGHVRYSTSGSSTLENAQPVLANYNDGKMALAFNGNIMNHAQLRAQLKEEGMIFQTSSDAETILALIRKLALRLSLEEAVAEAMRSLKGGYAVLLLTQHSLLAFRDPAGIRPLSMGEGDGIFFSSESCAFHPMRVRLIREVEPGEIVSVSAEGLRSRKPFSWPGKGSLCSFEFIYFAGIDSRICSLSIYGARLALGRELFLEHQVSGDLVAGIPDSGTTAALGYAAASGIPFGEAFAKNRYVGRTFIQPRQEMRETGVEIKLSPLEDNVRGKRVIMVDDSIVRGTTLKNLVIMLKDAGAREVHVMISSPPVKNPCFYGIDTPVRESLIASSFSIEEIQKKLQADTLHYLSVKGVMQALKEAKTGFCFACFNGEYPVKDEP